MEEKFSKILEDRLERVTPERLLLIYKEKINRPHVRYRCGNTGKTNVPIGDPRRSKSKTRRLSKEYYKWAIEKLSRDI